MPPVVADAPYASLAARHRELATGSRKQARSDHTAVLAAPCRPGHPYELLVSVDPVAGRAQLTLFGEGHEASGSGRATISERPCGTVEAKVSLRLRDDDGAEYGTVVSVLWVREHGMLLDQAVSVAGCAQVDLPSIGSLRLSALRWHPYNQLAGQRIPAAVGQ